MSKKLIYILNHYSHNSSSHFFHVLNLLEKMADKGVEIALIIEKCEDIPEIENLNIQLYGIHTSSKVKRSIALCRHLFKLRKHGYTKVFIRIASIAASQAIIVSWFTKQEIYYWLSGTTLDGYKKAPSSVKKIKSFFKSWLPYLFVKSYVDYFVTGPETMVDYYVQEGGIDRNKVLLLYNDIDIVRFRPLNEQDRLAKKKEFGFFKESNIILYVKRLSPIKGVMFYLPKILSEISDLCQELNYKVIIIGDGTEKTKLESEIERNHTKYTNVDILGAVPNSIVHSYYQISDIFMNATLEEGFPRVLIEAMACGMPVVTTDAGGIKDIIGAEQSNFMTPALDRELFTYKLKELMKDSAERNKLADENKKHAERFSTENVAKMYIENIF